MAIYADYNYTAAWVDCCVSPFVFVEGKKGVVEVEYAIDLSLARQASVAPSLTRAPKAISHCYCYHCKCNCKCNCCLNYHCNCHYNCRYKYHYNCHCNCNCNCD